MDIQLKKKPWFVRHKYYVSGGIVFLSLAAYTVALLFSPEKQRVSADTLGLAEAVQADFLEYVEQEGVVQPMLSLRVNSRISGYVERIVAEEGARGAGRVTRCWCCPIRAAGRDGGAGECPAQATHVLP